ncbi:hypothetical protein MUU47_16135 [Scandinavium sp. H11S7]|uniref:Uncharacterized protein n=1 Tax=Scandinavium hiltneri TaxID=2926519 RepID=A0ABT2E432_9ENTR|nr:hypothetical protein [Scandinavium hiltneri]MCS2162620.1 hypothetical protein [Scandinavium hiltneri]
MNWFKDIFGFEESVYAETQANFYLEGGLLHTRTQPPRSFYAGTLTLPSLAELRAEINSLAPTSDEKLKLSNLAADAHDLHRWPETNGALVQVASQFNLLEMPGPGTTPEQGISGYQYDHTQGPACAMACAAATVFRNYLVQIGDQVGQTQSNQLNTLEDLDRAINIPGIRMQNGYALLQPETIEAIGQYIQTLDVASLDDLRQRLRIGLHSDTEVTIPGVAKTQRVSQVLCSALPVAYHRGSSRYWAPFASLVLEASYEATLLAGVLNFHRTGNPRVYLTLVGGGAFGNETDWILSSLKRALRLVRHHPLEVILVSYRHVPQELVMLVEEFNADI